MVESLRTEIEEEVKYINEVTLKRDVLLSAADLNNPIKNKANSIKEYLRTELLREAEQESNYNEGKELELFSRISKCDP